MATAPAAEKPFHLVGNFAPVSDEITATDLPVEGAIPPELSGLYVRNGANPKSGTSEHWFLGDGMVHGVRLEGGRALWYRNRWVRTPSLLDPSAQRISATGQMDRTVSAANTHVLRHAGRLLALEEGSFPYVLDDELGTVGPCDFDGRLRSALTAHPKICPKTGEMIAFGYGQLPPYLTYLRFAKDGRLVQSEEITVGGPTMIHDFACTEHYAIFMDLPVVFDLQAALAGTMPFHWSDEYPARLGVMPRTGGDADVKWFDIPSCYVFHTVNAFEQGQSVVLDACRIEELWRDAGSFAGGGSQTLYRWTLDLARGTAKGEVLDERPMDFPRVPDAEVGLPYRFAYTTAIALEQDGPALNGLYKFDMQTGRSQVHGLGASLHPGEGVFVPGAGSRSGEEGYVMTYVYDDASDSSELRILDATDFAGPPVARVKLPQRVPYGFHGSWIGDDA